MDKFTDYIERFDVNFTDLINKSAKPAFDQITELNREQLWSGEDALGQVINTLGGRPYALSTMRIKSTKGQPTNRVTLKDTGAFYKTFKVKQVKSGFEVIADFSKDDGDIRDNFSSDFDFLGLQDESLNEWVNEYFYPEFTRNLRKEIL